MTTNLILWACVIWLPLLLYCVLQNETKFKKNIAIGVTLPQEARQDAEVLALLRQFKRRTLLICLALIIVAIPCMFIKTIGLMSTLWMIWIDCSIVLPYLPYIRYNQKLRQLKQRRGWQQNHNPTVVADLSAATQPIKWLSPWLFAVPLALSLLPLLFDYPYWILYAINAVTILFCWLGYRYLYRNKSEVVDDNMAVTEALTRIRRYHWGKRWLYCAWFLTAISILIWLTQKQALLMTGTIFLLAFAFAAIAVGIEFKTRRLQETLTAQSGTGFYVDDDDKWIWGLFYYDPNDNRLLINNRVGINTTVNLAKRSGQILTAALALTLLALPLLGVWMDHLESTPVALSIEQAAVVAQHTGREYQIPLDSITEVEYLNALPQISRVVGTGMDTVLKGKFKTPWGSASTCLYPRTAPYLLITCTDGKSYLLGSSDRQQTIAVYQQLLEKTS